MFPILQSFALPVKAVELQLTRKKLRRESVVGWFGLSFAPKPEFHKRIARQYRYSTRVSPDVALLELSSPSDRSCQDEKNNTQHTYTHKHLFTYIHVYIHVIHVYIHVIMDHQEHNQCWKVWIDVMGQCYEMCYVP